MYLQQHQPSATSSQLRIRKQPSDVLRSPSSSSHSGVQRLLKTWEKTEHNQNVEKVMDESERWQRQRLVYTLWVCAASASLPWKDYRMHFAILKNGDGAVKRRKWINAANTVSKSNQVSNRPTSKFAPSKSPSYRDDSSPIVPAHFSESTFVLSEWSARDVCETLRNEARDAARQSVFGFIASVYLRLSFPDCRLKKVGRSQVSAFLLTMNITIYLYPEEIAWSNGKLEIP